MPVMRASFGLNAVRIARPRAANSATNSSHGRCMVASKMGLPFWSTRPSGSSTTVTDCQPKMAAAKRKAKSTSDAAATPPIVMTLPSVAVGMPVRPP